MHKGCKLSPETHGHAKETNIGDENCSDRKANKTKRIHSLILHFFFANPAIFFSDSNMKL